MYSGTQSTSFLRISFANSELNRKIKNKKTQGLPSPSESKSPLYTSVSFLLSCILTCILSCKNRIASPCLTQDTACLGLVHEDDPERCYGEGGGRGGSCLGTHVRIKDFKI